MFPSFLFTATMVAGRGEQRCGRPRAASHFIARSVHGRLCLRRREPQRRREVLLWQAERDHGQKCRSNAAAGLGVHEGESKAAICLEEEKKHLLIRKTLDFPFPLSLYFFLHFRSSVIFR